MVTCSNCHQPLERRHRHGFLERYVLHPLGVYPWYCRDCRIIYYRRARPTGEQTRRSEVSIAPVIRDGTTKYTLVVMGGSPAVYETLESLFDSFYPPLKESLQKHITEIVRDQGLPVTFSLEDALEWP
jgi:hypothetical protein